ncbi:MAG: alcohol dehydrogenase catalytic domain-containing protein [Bacillota bacterium]
MSMMKAAIFTGIQQIGVQEIPIPHCEEDGILVRVESCGICGSDIRNYHNGLRAGIKEQIIGHEIAGVVVEAGSKVSRFQVGDQVAIAPDVSCGECYYCKRGLVNLCVDHKMVGTHWPGGFAQYVYLPAAVLNRGFVEHIPAGLSFEEASLSEPASSVIASQEMINVSLGDTLVIFGDGPIGCLHIEVAKARGATKVIMIGRRKLELARQFGPTHLINSNEQDPVQEVLKITGGLGADCCICANPNAVTQQQGVEMVRKRGTVVLFGGLPKNEPMTTLNSNMIHYNEISVVGAFSYDRTVPGRALQLIREGKIEAAKYISKTVSLEEIPAGITYVKQGKALKVIVKPWA